MQLFLISILGLYLGYPEKEKHRVWVNCKKDDITAAEKSAADYGGLAVKLMDIVFKSELQDPE